MVKLYDEGIYLVNGTEIVPESEGAKVQALTGKAADKETAKKGTMACSILSAHNTSGDMEHLKLKFDAMTSHDITFVGVIQTAKASGMEKFPVPYVLTNCHNSLCAVGGTINEDDHMFGLSAAKKYGGIYVPPHIAVIHQYMREMMAGCGRMILGSDSHTRYGALGTMAIGEGGGELVKQLLKDTYDVAYPGVVAVYLDGAPRPGTGPQDIALAIIGAVFKNGYVKNKVMEFVGPGVASMTTDYRNGVDVMTTETTCLSSIWKTDSDTRAYLAKHQKEPTVDEIARILDIKREDVVFALDAILEPVSLYEPIYSDSGDTVCVMDQVKDSKNTDEMWLERIALKEAVSRLTPREQKILSMRFYHSKTQMEVSEEIGISQAQVSRLEKNALRQIRKEL